LCTSLHFILKTYSLLSGQDFQAIHRVTARTYGLNRLDGMMTDLQNLHWAMQRSSQCISWRPIIMPSNLYITQSNFMCFKMQFYIVLSCK